MSETAIKDAILRWLREQGCYAVGQRRGARFSPSPAVLVRFWEKVRITDGCWLWMGGTIKGYGCFNSGIERVSQYAHRFAYYLWYGLEERILDHQCDTPSCVRPHHLKPTTHKENILRGRSFSAINARKTRCPTGHPYIESNIYYLRGQRYCRTCRSSQGIKQRDAGLTKTVNVR